MSTLFRYDARLMSLNGLLLKMPDDYFIFKIDTTKGNGFNSFQLPFRSGRSYDCYVDFGDGTGWKHITAYNQAETLHPYATSGIYTVKVRGYVGAWYDNNSGDVLKYIECSKFGSTEFGSLEGMFYGASNLKVTADLGPYMPTGTTAVNLLRSSGIDHVPSKILARMPNVLLLTNVMNGCTAITSQIPYDILHYVPNVENLNAFLANNTNMTGHIPVGFLRYVTKLTTCLFLLGNNPNLTGSVPDDLLMYVVDVINITYILQGNTGLTGSMHPDMFRYVTKVNSLSYVLNGCIGISGNLPTLRYMPNISNMLNAFNGMRSLSLPPDLFDLTNIYKIANWENALRVTLAAYSHTGTLQPIWDYASPTATGKSTAFLNCIALTNYDELRTNWP